MTPFSRSIDLGRWFLLVTVVTSVALAACTAAARPATGDGASGAPSADATEQIASEPLDCETDGYPCSLADVPPAIVATSRALGKDAQERIAAGSTVADAATWLESQPGIASIVSDELTIRFRLDGGRPVWILGQDAPSDLAAAAPHPAIDRTGALIRASSARYFSPRSPRAGEQSGSLGAVVSGESGARSATVLAPFAYGEGAYGARSIADVLEATRGYAGHVTYAESSSPTDETVAVGSFSKLAGESVVYIKSAAGAVCEDGACRMVIAVQALDDPELHLTEDQDAILDIVVFRDGKEALAVTPDFFRRMYPGGLRDAIIVLDLAMASPMTASTSFDLVRAVKARSSEVYMWQGYAPAETTVLVIQSFIANLAETGRTTAVVYHEMVDELVSGPARFIGIASSQSPALRIRDVVHLVDPEAGDPLTADQAIAVVGSPGDSRTDTVHVAVEIDGIPVDEAGKTTVNVVLDGTQSEPLLVSEGERLSDFAWLVQADVVLPDFTEGQSVTLEAVAQLVEGGLSQESLPVTLGGSDLGTIWEGTSTATIMFTEGVSITLTTQATFTREESSSPNPERVTFSLTSGQLEWSLDGTTPKGCIHSGTPLTVPLEADEYSTLVFDLAAANAGGIPYSGKASLEDGADTQVSITCPGRDPQTHISGVEGTWFLAPQAEAMLMSGGTASGGYSTGGSLPTTFEWSFHKVK